MNKIISLLYNIFKIKYFRCTYNWNLIFMTALAEVYNNPLMLNILKVDFEQYDIGATKTSMVICTIYTKRPGLIIGKAGKDIDALKNKLLKYIGKQVSIEIKEINDDTRRLR